MDKKMILVAAPPACGKTTVSEWICRALGHAAYFDKDDYSGLINLIFDLTGHERDLDSAFYRENVKRTQYETLFHMAKVALQYEDTVLLNAPFADEIRHPEKLKKLRETLNADGTGLFVVWVLATPEQCRERMRKRNAERDAGKLADWESFVKTIDFSVPEYLEKEGAADRLLVVDSTDPERYRNSLEETVREIKSGRE